MESLYKERGHELMEWEIIISLFDWELLISTLSILLGTVSLSVYGWTKTKKGINSYNCTDIKVISKNINIDWLTISIVHPSKLYLLLIKFMFYKDETVKDGSSLSNSFNIK